MIPSLTPQQVEAAAQAVTTPPAQVLSSPFVAGPLKTVFAGMAVCGYNPRPAERGRIYLMGLRKSFKTSFCCSHPGCCVLDFEGGANAVMTPRAFTVNLSGGATLSPGQPGYEEERKWLLLSPWDRFQKIKAALILDGRSQAPQFSTIAIDSSDLMAEVMVDRFCQEQGVADIGEYKTKGAGYGMVRVQMFRQLKDLEDAGYGLIVTAHLSEKILTNEDGTNRIIVDNWIFDSFHRAFLRWADQVLNIYLTVTSMPTKRTIRLTDGSAAVIDDKVNRVEEALIELRTIPTPDNRERGCRVQVPDRLRLPFADAWQVYRKAYQEEISRVQRQLKSTGAPGVTGPQRSS